MKEVFQTLDKNKSGTISTSEFKEALKLMGLELSVEEIKHILRRYDENNDHQMNYSEFEKILLDIMLY